MKQPLLFGVEHGQQLTSEILTPEGSLRGVRLILRCASLSIGLLQGCEGGHARELTKEVAGGVPADCAQISQKRIAIWDLPKVAISERLQTP